MYIHILIYRYICTNKQFTHFLSLFSSTVRLINRCTVLNVMISLSPLSSYTHISILLSLTVSTSCTALPLLMTFPSQNFTHRTCVTSRMGTGLDLSWSTMGREKRDLRTMPVVVVVVADGDGGGKVSSALERDFLLNSVCLFCSGLAPPPPPRPPLLLFMI